VSGSGKSTLINDTLYHAVARTVQQHHRAAVARRDPRLEFYGKVINVDQSPIGRMINPATHTGCSRRSASCSRR
jgi:excinuclease ABC subunit A